MYRDGELYRFDGAVRAGNLRVREDAVARRVEVSVPGETELVESAEQRALELHAPLWRIVLHAHARPATSPAIPAPAPKYAVAAELGIAGRPPTMTTRGHRRATAGPTVTVTPEEVDRPRRELQPRGAYGAKYRR